MNILINATMIPSKCYDGKFNNRFLKIVFITTFKKRCTRAKCKILFLAVNPVDTERLRLDEEIRDIKNKIRLSDLRDELK